MFPLEIDLEMNLKKYLQDLNMEFDLNFFNNLNALGLPDDGDKGQKSRDVENRIIRVIDALHFDNRSCWG